jgi:hypothetical protein
MPSAAAKTGANSSAGEPKVKCALPAWEKVQSRLRRQLGDQAWNKLLQRTRPIAGLTRFEELRKTNPVARKEAVTRDPSAFRQNKFHAMSGVPERRDPGAEENRMNVQADFVHQARA